MKRNYPAKVRSAKAIQGSLNVHILNQQSVYIPATFKDLIKVHLGRVQVTYFK